MHFCLTISGYSINQTNTINNMSAVRQQKRKKSVIIIFWSSNTNKKNNETIAKTLRQRPYLTPFCALLFVALGCSSKKQDKIKHHSKIAQFPRGWSGIFRPSLRFDREAHLEKRNRTNVAARVRLTTYQSLMRCKQRKHNVWFIFDRYIRLLAKAQNTLSRKRVRKKGKML